MEIFFWNTCSDARTTPTQSKSFRILQKITDTVDEANNNNGHHPGLAMKSMATTEPQLQRPHYARQMSGLKGGNISPGVSNVTDHMSKIQLNQEKGNEIKETRSIYHLLIDTIYLQIVTNNNNFRPVNKK